MSLSRVSEPLHTVCSRLCSSLTLQHQEAVSHLFCVMRGGSAPCCPSPGSPVSGMPCARCILELRTSLAETKKILPGASSRPTTFSSSARKLTQRSRCCFLTWTAGGGHRGETRPSPTNQRAGFCIAMVNKSNLLDVLWLAH